MGRRAVAVVIGLVAVLGACGPAGPLTPAAAPAPPPPAPDTAVAAGSPITEPTPGLLVLPPGRDAPLTTASDPPSACGQGRCTLAVSGPVRIPLDARFGIPSLELARDGGQVAISTDYHGPAELDLLMAPGVVPLRTPIPDGSLPAPVTLSGLNDCLGVSTIVIAFSGRDGDGAPIVTLTPTTRA